MNNIFNKMIPSVLMLMLSSDIDNALAMNAKPSLISSTKHALSDDTLEFLANASEDDLKKNVCINLVTTHKAPRNIVIYEGKISTRVDSKRIEEGKCFIYTHWVYEPNDATLDRVSICTPTGSYDFKEGPLYEIFHEPAADEFEASMRNNRQEK